MRAAALQSVDGSPHSLPKALRSGSCTTLTLDRTMADRLGIGTWHYRAEVDRVVLTGCLVVHLFGVEAAELPLATLLGRLDAASADRLAAGLRTAMPSDGITFESHSHTAGHVWFRLLGSDGASGFVQRLGGSGHEPGTTGNRQRLRLALEAGLARAAASKQSGIVLLLVKIEQLAFLEQSRAPGRSLADTVIERLERLPHAHAGYRLESDIIALLLDEELGGTDERPGDARLRASDCVRRARVALRAPVGLAGRDYVLTTTIGAATCPRRLPVSAETLWQRAEVALAYAQKQHHRGRHIVFTRRIAAELADRLTLENELRQALARDELELRYQPIVALQHRRVSGLEVLMRWQHPTRGLVPPDIFIPLAEQLGLVQPLTEWLLRTAASELANHLEAAPHLRVNINLSARQATPALIGALLRQFADGAALTPARVTFEVTEGALLENVAPALEALNELKSKGCRIALDDFGTGFSSISYLEQFPIDAIKIDKGFVHRIGKSAESRKLVEAMLFMADALELDCVAEGVEDVEELAFLAAKGCRHVQGFLFSKPLTAAELEAFLDRFRFPEEALTEALWPKAKGLPRLLSDNQEEALKLFVKHVPLAVAMFDSDMRYLAASDRWIRDYGIDEEDLVGRCHYDVLPDTPQKWRDGHARVMASGLVERSAVDSYRHASGRIDWLRWEVRPFHNSFGDVAGLIIFSEFITARVEAEQALIRQSEQLAFAGQLAGVGYWRTDLRRHTVDWSPEIYNIIGRTPAAFTPDIANRFDIFHPDDQRQAMTAVLEAAESGSDLHYEARVRRPDGSIRFIVCHGRPELEKSARLKGFFGIFQDITEHRRAAVAAAHQAEQLALAGEIAGIGYWTHDSTTDTTFRSDEIQRITGRPTAARSTAAAGPGSAILHPEDLHPDDRAAHATAWRQALATGADLEDRRRVVRPDGTVRHVLIKARGRQDETGRTIGYFGIVHDITEQIETAATIAARNRENELYRAMIDILPDFIFAKDKAGRFLAANAATATLMGAGRPAELIGRTDHNFYEPAIADRFRADEEAFMARGETVILEQPGRRIDGSAGFLCSLKAPMRDAQGRLTGYVGHGRDITEEKRAQAALVESEAHFRQLVDGSLQALVIEQDEMVVFANDRFARLLGYPGSAQAIADATARYDRQPRATRQILARLGGRLARGETIEAATRLDLVRVDGERITVDCLACSIAWQGRPALQYTMIDVTRQVRYEAELEAEKTRLAAQADEMTRLAAALARSKLEAEAARDMLNDATAVLSDGFALFAAESRIISCNPAFAALHGCPAEELVGSSIGDCVAQLSRHGPHPPDSEAARQMSEARLRAHYRADGTPFELQLGNRWFVIRENRTVNGMTTLVCSEITHLKRIQDELERLATIDVLTELANRRHFVDQATRLLARCRDEAVPAALLMFDIDRFKLINDRHGHAVGDHALCRMAAICREQLRPMDLVARWGGEEFVVLLPRLTLDDATLVADRLRRAVAGTLIRAAAADIGFTISIGLVGCSPDEPLEALINRADAALYDAKLKGRDRIVVDPTGSSIPPATFDVTKVA